MINITKSSGGGSSTADAITYTPNGDLTATDVQAAIDELEEKVSIIDGGAAPDPVV